MHIQTTECCGIIEYVGIYETLPEDCIKELLAWLGKPAYAYFSHTEYHLERGRQLEEYINKKNLGQVTRIGPHLNRNSENFLYMWVWAINWDEINKIKTERQASKDDLRY